MNDLVKAVLNHEYSDSNMKKNVYIYKRTKKERIKNKAFKKLLSAYIGDRPFVITGGVVLMKHDIYEEFASQIKTIEEYIVSWKDVNVAES